MNLVLYLGIFIVYSLLNFKFISEKLLYNSKALYYNKFNSRFNNYNIFIKTQNFQNQINQTITVRVWTKFNNNNRL